MNILAIDTATSVVCVTLKKCEQYYSKHSVGTRQQAEVILSLIDEVLKKTGTKLSDLNCLAFGAGPASFTGIRLAFSVVQGLALANNLPVVALNSLQVLAQEFYRKHLHRQIAVCNNAHMGQLFWATYVANEQGYLQAQQETILVAPENLPPLQGIDWVGIGSGWQAYPSLSQLFIEKHFIKIYDDFLPLTATSMANLAESAYRSGLAQIVDKIELTYLRSGDAWKKLK